MHSFLRFRWLLTLLLGLGNLLAVQASHLRGGDITYHSVPSTTAGVPRYHIAVREFEEGTIPPTTTIQLTAALNGCYTTSNASNLSILVNSTTTTVGALGCSSAAPLYRITVFETDLNLPAGSWRVSTYSSARIPSIQNITASAATNVYLEATIESSLALPDTSPQFESILQPLISTTALAQHSFSTFDADGDSLRYEQLMPYSECGASVTGTLQPHFHLNFGTGAFEPLVTSTSTQGYYDATVKVSEYRHLSTGRWALIGSVMRDNLYLLLLTSNQPPTFTTMQVNGAAAQALGPAIAAQRGQPVSVLLQATDPDVGQTVHFVSESPNVVPGLSLTQVGTTGGVQLTWQVPATLPPGRYTIAVGVLDNNCGSEERTLTFVVGSAALATRPGALAATDVYPTPFREQVQFTTAPNQGVVLFDALGREVARLTSAATGLVRWQPAAALPAGLYFACSAANGQPLARLLRAE